VIRRIIGTRPPATSGKASRLRKYAKRAGMVAATLVALDLVATVVTLALGWSVIQ